MQLLEIRRSDDNLTIKCFKPVMQLEVLSLTLEEDS